ncbi:hypothetical protein [Nostoc sp. CCY 9925]|uniref:hypothetical protein n=1 Tax=Nostoc sp. CCY 9925 TaxID=3103865 RepID=UPI0039C757AF
MVNLNTSNNAGNDFMGAVPMKVKLTNAIDEALVSRGMLNPNMLRVYETEALVHTVFTGQNHGIYQKPW